ncbi:MAG TPA: EAL domain-containing protein [Thermoanaerobaculia bacterium]|jgi:diguanylate cyclase (GGDEF)-like protein|nr:EAL domain-containing protein [Thermoanaerobaculia bacterium]
MAVRSFQARLLYLLIAILVLLEAGMLISVHYAGRRTLQQSIADDLRVGARVLERILQTRARQLSDSLRVLARDFAFREAVAFTDLPTVTSVLDNHGRRIDADVVVLIALDGTVTADTVGGRMAGQPFPFAAMLKIAEADAEGQASATVSFAGRPYQFVIVPVLAPRAIAWVSAGFEIDETVLEDVANLTSLDVSIWSTGSNALLISTLRPDARDELRQLLTARSATPQSLETTFDLGSDTYATLLRPLPTGDQSHVYSIVQRSLAEARRPFVTLERQVFALSFAILLIAIIAAVLFARTVSRPLQVLADGAGRVERGDYISPIVVKQQDEIGHLATAFNTMQAAIAAREEQITYQSTHDALTSLPNRSRFLSRVAQAIAARKRNSNAPAIGLIVMDVNRFKDVNDTLGHHFGDQLLIEIGRRLSQTIGANDTVARLGGDEFAIKFSVPDARHAIEVAARVATTFAEPFVLGDVSIEVNASLGIALYPDHADDADTLIKRADIAMYEAKKNQSGVAMYEAGLDEQSLRRLSLMMELRQAIAGGELELYYQPKIDVATARVVHVEALVRWNHPRHGVMPPDEFIPLAEQSGRIGLITKWAIRTAIAQCATWRRDGLDLTVAVNLSALDLLDSELPTFISGLLADAELPPGKLVLEITESAVMKDAAYAQKVLAELKRRGLCLAIDDFGTGYSSLAHLKRLPVDELKIDKSFVLNLSESAADDLVIVRSTIELAHNMGLIVIAEGVESAESWKILKRLGCDMAQGYYMSRPLPVVAITEWFRTSAWGIG